MNPFLPVIQLDTVDFSQTKAYFENTELHTTHLVVA